VSEILSSHRVAQILAFFLDNKKFDYLPGKIAEKAGLAFRTVFRMISNLEQDHI
jgi:hypothetical protein